MFDWILNVLLETSLVLKEITLEQGKLSYTYAAGVLSTSNIVGRPN